MSDLARLEFRVVLIDRESMRVLTTAGAARPSIPRATISAYSRIAEALSSEIRRRFGLDTIQLTSLTGTGGAHSCSVHEIVGARDAVKEPYDLTALDDIASGELASEERESVVRIMTGKASGLGRFARLGWIDELLRKIGIRCDRGHPPAIRHINRGTNFCLLFLEDDNGRRLWFKAVGEPNSREYAITLELAQRFPSYAPRIILEIPEWSGWVMEEVAGTPLNEAISIAQCDQAFRALAILQKEMAEEADSLLAMGAKDWRQRQIASLLDPFFLDALSAMEAQSSVRSKPLSASDLNHLRLDITSTLDQFMAAGIPDTLVHGDIGHGNILATSTGPVFLDWAEASVGHPFLCAEHLLADLARSNPLFREEQSNLRHQYIAHWAAYVRPAVLEKLEAFAPAVAVFVYALAIWAANRNRPDPTQAWPLIRSLLRRTRQELELAAEVMA